MSDNKLCLTVLALGVEQRNADALLLVRSVMGNTIIVQFVRSLLKPVDATNWWRSSGVPSS